MKRPKSLRVGPFDIAIVPMHEIHQATDLGNYAYDKHEIRLLDSYVNKKLEAEVLLHEVLHAVYSIYNIKDDDREERIVSIMATGLAQVLRDNRPFADWLRGSLK